MSLSLLPFYLNISKLTKYYKISMYLQCSVLQWWSTKLYWYNAVQSGSSSCIPFCRMYFVKSHEYYCHKISITRMELPKTCRGICFPFSLPPPPSHFLVPPPNSLSLAIACFLPFLPSFFHIFQSLLSPSRLRRLSCGCLFPLNHFSCWIFVYFISKHFYPVLPKLKVQLYLGRGFSCPYKPLYGTELMFHDQVTTMIQDTVVWE